MKTVFVLILVCLFGYVIFAESPTQQQADRAAKNIWGAGGFARKSGRNYQVGCTVSGVTIVAGTSTQDYSAALAAVDLKINGAHVIGAEARDTAGNTASAAPVVVILCNP